MTKNDKIQDPGKGLIFTKTETSIGPTEKVYANTSFVN